jgi:hypothetical protein|mmetsp:Transcript_78342/g.123701  ORF Transcript_78342/g.123701 Transcript_78342/m.123701 type:complete len:276 (-) Transcript_78342:231-1058(-)
MTALVEYPAFLENVFDLVPFLHVADLQRLQMVSDGAKRLLDEPKIWHTWIENVLPSFTFTQELLRVPQRAALHAITVPLFGLKVVDSEVPVPINEVKDAEALAHLVEQTVDRQHLERDATSTQIILGCMRFPNGIVSSSGRDPIASFPIAFNTSKELREVTKIKGDKMNIKFAWIGGELFAKVEDSTPAMLGNLVTIDINSCDPAALLDKRNNTLRINEGTWQPLVGASTFRNGKAAVSEHVKTLTKGVLVTINVRGATKVPGPVPMKKRFSYPW